MVSFKSDRCPRNNFSRNVSNELVDVYRPGGELNPGEDEVDGLKRLMTEVFMIIIEKKNRYVLFVRRVSKPSLNIFSDRLWVDKTVSSKIGQLRTLLAIGGDLTLSQHNIHIFCHISQNQKSISGYFSSSFKKKVSSIILNSGLH